MSETPEARYWTKLDDGRIRCDLCPRYCHLREGQRGFCFVRMVRDGRMVLTTYGRSTGFCVDPIEKKPLNHFLPGSAILSFGTAGCNLGCRFCQNWGISKSHEVEALSEEAAPETIADAARRLGCSSVAFTYNDPVIWAEYAIDTAKACHEKGLAAVAVTAGYITDEARPWFFSGIDAANVDLKAFSPEFYKEVCLSGKGGIEDVKKTLVWLARESEVWFEITTLLIPGLNDSDEEIRRECEWILNELGPDRPVHFTAYHPDYKLLDRPPTPPETLTRARRIALEVGLHYPYTGNVHDIEGQTTFCPGCKSPLVVRDGYEILEYHLDHRGVCPKCGHRIAGRFTDAPGRWGSRRLPVRLTAVP